MKLDLKLSLLHTLALKDEQNFTAGKYKNNKTK